MTVEHVQNYPGDIKPKDTLDLWKYFEGKGEADKQRMITIVSWLLGFATAILGFTVAQNVKFDVSQELRFCVERPTQVGLLSVLGLLICLYCTFLVFEFGIHARGNWERAEKFLDEMPRLKDRLKPRAFEPKNINRVFARARNMPPVFYRFLIVVGVTGIFYIVLLGWLTGFADACPTPS